MLFLATALAAGTADFGAKGFNIQDAEGKNTLNLGLSFQPRFTTTLTPDADTLLNDTGIRVRRMLFLANGTLAGRIDYKFRINAANPLSFSDPDGKTQLASKPILDDAQLIFRIADPFNISAGQWKVPFTLSQAMSDTYLLFPDRPIVIDGFKLGDTKADGYGYSRDAGFAILGSNPHFEYSIGAFNGDGTNVWPNDSRMLFAGRIQVTPLGEFKYDEVDLKHDKARLGIGLSAAQNSHPTDDGNDTTLRVGGDLRFAIAGLTLQGEALYGRTQTADTLTPSLGAYAQLGYTIGNNITPGFRWSLLDPSLDATDDRITHVEGVVNFYLPDPQKAGSNLGHKAQIQLAWTTSLQEGAQAPLGHQLQLATAVSF